MSQRYALTYQDLNILVMTRHINAVAWLVATMALSGCVTGHSRPPVAPSSAPSATSAAVARYQATVARIHAENGRIAAHIHAEEREASTMPTFQRVVWHLQSLGYLPISHAFIHGPDGVAIRHDAFLWPVPKPLQDAVDQYTWDANNPFIRGAVIQFERVNGILGPKGVSEGRLREPVVKAILSAAAKPDPYPYEWAYVTKASGAKQPERLHIWRQPCGQHRSGWILQSKINTGVLGSTPNGTWPIYQRLPSTTMRGVFPVLVSRLTYAAMEGQRVPQWAGSALTQSAVGMVDGHPVCWQPYNDPGIKWVNYFDDGRGIHYYPRTSYGFPQSAGCVEEPRKAARIAYGLLRYGVPVTVSKDVFL